MKELAVQKFLRGGGTLEELRKPPYSLIVKEESSLVLLKYTQGVSDGFNPIVNECRGIVLDRDNNWFAVCHPFHRFYNAGQPEAAKLGDLLKVYEKKDGCFCSREKVLLADGTKKSIGEIVRKKLPLEVLSYNFETGKIEPKKIVGWSKKESKKDEWLTFDLRGVECSLVGESMSQHNSVRVTKNHVFYTKGLKEIFAEDLKEGDVIYTPKKGLTKTERQVAIGSLLGDGSLNYYQEQYYYTKKSLRFLHSRKQKDYVIYKAKFLEKLGGKVEDKIYKNSFAPEKTYFQTLTHQGFYDIYNLFFETGKKKISKRILEELNWFGFAVWYMDDGSLNKSQKNMSISLHTEGYTLEENEIIHSFYQESGYKNYIRNDGKGHYFINFSTMASEEIWKNIREYICPSMQYKLPERHQGYFVENYHLNEERELYLYPGIIEKITQGFKGNYPWASKYDIEVEDNHNYFCQGVLVHNSLCKVYNYRGEWMCGSNTTINARNTLIDGRFNFFELVEAALAVNGFSWESFTQKLNPTHTYMFELVCPETRQVVDYGDRRELVYLGERNNYTFEEQFTPIAGLAYPKIYPLTTMEEIAVAVEELGDNAEGFVVVDENWNRNKVKSSNYFKLHYAANNGRPKILEMILSGEDAEFLAYFPQYKKQFDEMRQKMNDVIYYAAVLKDNTSYFWELCRKDFVAAIDVEKPFAGWVFKCYENHSLAWSEYVDANKWKRFLKRAE